MGCRVNCATLRHSQQVSQTKLRKLRKDTPVCATASLASPLFIGVTSVAVTRGVTGDDTASRSADEEIRDLIAYAHAFLSRAAKTISVADLQLIADEVEALIDSRLDDATWDDAPARGLFERLHRLIDRRASKSFAPRRTVMTSDPFYLTPEWQRLRAECIARDGGRCTVPACRTPTYRLTADHIVSRRNGGPDTLENLRTLCLTHDAQVREAPSGQRRNDGRAYQKGCDASGRPLDPAHPWAKR